MFDYLFYRFYDVYKRKEGDNSVFSASAAISFIQILIISSIIFSINFITSIAYSINFIAPNLQKVDKGISTVIVISLSILLLIYNNIKYRKKLNKLILKYSSSPLNKKLKMWIIFMIIPMTMMLPFILRYILKLLKETVW